MRRATVITENLQRTRLAWIAPQIAFAFERRQMAVDGRAAGQAHRLADLAYRRRIAVCLGVTLHKRQDVILSPCKLRRHIDPPTHAPVNDSNSVDRRQTHVRLCESEPKRGLRGPQTA